MMLLLSHTPLVLFKCFLHLSMAMISRYLISNSQLGLVHVLCVSLHLTPLKVVIEMTWLQANLNGILFFPFVFALRGPKPNLF